jgi:hypothetical protein
VEIRDLQIRFTGPCGALPKAKNAQKRESTKKFFHMSPAELITQVMQIFGGKTKKRKTEANNYR